MSGGTSPLVHYDSVTHRFRDGTEGISSVNLTVNRGDFVILAGRNGSGKTVLMKHLNGLLRPTSGRITYRGVPLEKDLLTVRQKIGLVFQNSDTQIVCHTVREEVAFGPENLGLPREEVEERVDSALLLLDLKNLEERTTITLSGGEKRKLCIAGIVAMEPEVLALDEPFIGLDMEGVREVLRQVLKLHAAGTTIFLITHEIEKVLAHANRLVIMEKGRIAEDGTPEDLVGSLETYGIKNPQGAYREWREFSWLS